MGHVFENIYTPEITLISIPAANNTYGSEPIQLKPVLLIRIHIIMAPWIWVRIHYFHADLDSGNYNCIKFNKIFIKLSLNSQEKIVGTYMFSIHDGLLMV